MANPFEKPNWPEREIHEKKCPECNGRGSKDGKKCERCDGKGTVLGK